MPALSPTMEKGNLASWKKQVGDAIKVGESMAEVETDKATVAFEAVEEGYLAKILIADGTQDIVVGTPVAVLAENKEDIEKFKDFGGAAGAGKVAAKQEAPAAAPVAPAAAAAAPAPVAETSGSASSSGGRIIASPAAKRIAGEKGVSLEGIRGTGPDGRILSADVHEQGEAVQAQAKSAKPAAPLPSAPAVGDYTDLPHSNIRKVIAQRLSQSKSTIPHYYLSIESNVEKLLKVRSELNAKAEKEAGKDASVVKLSVNDFLVKAAALACRKVPAVNSSWMDSAIRQYNYVDVSVAVSTDTGLVTPIVKDADIKGLSTISADTKALAAKARANKLQPSEYQGGTFTISNLGMFGVTNFSAIINPPQAAILAVGTTVARVVEVTPGQFVTQQTLSVTLSCDHRVVDGAVGAQWLQAFKGYVENPITMLL